MSIYPDRKRGKLTGRFRVEVMIDGKRLRGRADSLDAARTMQDTFERKLATGDPVALATAKSHDGTGRPTTLRALLHKAAKPLWKETRHGTLAKAQVERVIKHFGDKRLADVTTAFVDDVISWLESLEASTATINRYLAALSAVLSWGMQPGREYIARMPHFEWQKEEDGRIRVITMDEEATVNLFLVNADQGRIAAFVQVLIDTGCRCGELLQVAPQQVNNGRLTLWGAQTKSGKTRTVALTPRALAHLQRELPWKFSRSQLRYWWDRMREGLGLGEDFVLHACRHTCATRLLERGVDPRTVQEWMGHANLKTTERYLHTTTTRLDAAAKALAREEGEESRPISGAVTKLR